MPWENRTVEEQRREFALEAQHTDNFSELCREYGITRATGYKWLKRFEDGGPLSDLSRRPHTSPNRTPEAIEEAILSLRRDNPGWGARRIHCILMGKGIQMPCVKTVNTILNRNGMISEEESLKHKPFTRFEMEHCNDLWQTDFKGEFRVGDNNYCYPLNILDDHSRFSIRISCTANTKNVVIPAFSEAFREFGLPLAILSDNGGQFAGFRRGCTQFEKWLMRLGVLPLHGRPMHPQTQGKIERFHRTMKNELLKYSFFANIDEANAALQRWRDKYNNERPHEALGMRCPAQVYVPSERELPVKLPPIEYSGEYHVIKVNSWGYVRFAGHQIYLSETMIDEYIEFRANPLGDSFFACFGGFKIAEFSTITGELLNRNISRL